MGRPKEVAMHAVSCQGGLILAAIGARLRAFCMHTHTHRGIHGIHEHLTRCLHVHTQVGSRYKLLKILGMGGFSCVVLAEDTEKDELVRACFADLGIL